MASGGGYYKLRGPAVGGENKPTPNSTVTTFGRPLGGALDDSVEFSFGSINEAVTARIGVRTMVEGQLRVERLAVVPTVNLNPIYKLEDAPPGDFVVWFEGATTGDVLFRSYRSAKVAS